MSDILKYFCQNLQNKLKDIINISILKEMVSQYTAYLRSEEFLYEDHEGLSLLIIAVLEEDIDLLNKYRCMMDYAFNSTDMYGNTPLHVAVIENKLKSFDFLLAQDSVSVDAINLIWQTPLFNACRNNKLEMCKSLIKSGATVNFTDCHGNTPLHVAVYNPEITKLLIENGADINKQSLGRDTPLHNAVTVENLETVCMLLYYNCNTGIQNSEGNTPFMDSLIFENIPIQSALFDYIEDFNVSSIDGDTILTLALTYQSPYVEQILARGAEVNRRALESSFMIGKYSIFETIWKRIPNEELENSNLLDKFAYGMRRNNILNYIDIILENSNDSKLESLANCFNCQLSFTDLIEKCAYTRGVEQLTKLTCVLLQYNCRFLLPSILQVYVYFGHCDLFKYFLYMDYSIEKTDCDISLGWIIPLYIYDISSDMKTICKEISFDSPRDFAHIKASIKSLEYTINPYLVQLLTRYLCEDKEFMKILEKIPLVPSLLELSRDKVRKYITDRFNLTRPSQYYTFINNIDIATVYKQIITLERRIYNFNLSER